MTEKTTEFVKKDLLNVNEDKINKLKTMFTELRDYTIYIIESFRMILDYNKNIIQLLNKCKNDTVKPFVEYKNKFSNFSSFVNPYNILNANREFMVDTLESGRQTVSNVINILEEFKNLNATILERSPKIKTGLIEIPKIIYNDMNDMMSYYKGSFENIKNKSSILYTEYKGLFNNIAEEHKKLMNMIKNFDGLINLLEIDTMLDNSSRQQSFSETTQILKTDAEQTTIFIKELKDEVLPALKKVIEALMSGSKFPKGQWLAAWDCANYKQLCKSGKKYHVGLDCFCA